MKITYDPKANAMYIKLNQKPFHPTRVISDTMILNMAEDDMLIGIELLGVSRYTEDLQAFIQQLDSMTQQAPSPK